MLKDDIDRQTDRQTDRQQQGLCLYSPIFPRTSQMQNRYY